PAGEPPGDDPGIDRQHARRAARRCYRSRRQAAGAGHHQVPPRTYHRARPSQAGDPVLRVLRGGEEGIESAVTIRFCGVPAKGKTRMKTERSKGLLTLVLATLLYAPVALGTPPPDSD